MHIVLTTHIHTQTHTYIHTYTHTHTYTHRHTETNNALSQGSEGLSKFLEREIPRLRFAWLEGFDPWVLLW